MQYLDPHNKDRESEGRRERERGDGSLPRHRRSLQKDIDLVAAGTVAGGSVKRVKVGMAWAVMVIFF